MSRRRKQTAANDPQAEVPLTAGERAIIDAMTAFHARTSARLSQIEAQIAELVEKKKLKTVAKVQRDEGTRRRVHHEAQKKLEQNPATETEKDFANDFWREFGR